MTHLKRMSLAAGLCAAGCEADDYASGQSEPVRVLEGVFHAGEIPSDATATTPLVTNAGGVNSIVTQGQSSREFTGSATADGYSVAIALPTLGTGYWVVPLGAPDVTLDDQLLFKATLDFTAEVPHGLQTLTFVAIDGEGNPGPRYDTEVCVLPAASNNNIAACDPAVTPQNAVLSLTWDTNVDLDLIVVAPNGKVVSGKQPSTGLLEVGATSIPSDVLNDPATGQITRDSNANCDIDGIRRESLVFTGEPPAGDYQVFVSLHRACGEPYVYYGLDLYRRVDAADGTHPVDRTHIGDGQLVSAQATGGATLGTHVTTLTFPPTP